MNLLLLNFIICTALAAIIQILPQPHKEKEKIYMVFSFLLLLFFHSFADPFSLDDLPVYYQRFNDLSTMSWAECVHVQDFNMELGYRLFMKLVTFVSTDFTLFLFVYSLFLLLLYYFVIKNYSPSLILSILVFLLTTYNQSLFVIRQHLAVACCLATIPLIVNRDLIKYMLLCVIAFLLHRSAIIFIPMYFLYNVDLRKFNRWVIIGGGALFFVFGPLLIRLASELGYYSYAINETYEGMNYVGFFISVSFLILFVLTLKKEDYSSGVNKIVYLALVFSTLIDLFGVGYAIGRLGLYFSVFTILAFPISISQIKNQFVKVGLIVIVLMLLFYPIYLGSAKEYWKFYRLIW